MNTKRIMIILLVVVGILAIGLIAFNPFSDIGSNAPPEEETSQYLDIATI